MIDRRDFIKISALAGTSALAGFTPFNTMNKGRVRTFSLCTNTAILNSHPEFLDLFAKSGVTDVWIPIFLNGFWPYPIEDLLNWKAKIEKKGIAVNSLSVPFGHPSNSLGGDTSFDVPPQNWPRSVDVDGKKYSGTSVHSVVTEENIAVIQKAGKSGFKKLFLDDDFRLARSPGTIGGCFCDWHKQDYTTKYGYNEQTWMQLKQDIKNRELSPLLRNWIEYSCDQLTNSFRAQHAAAPEVALGIMVMYLGSEKAGIRLDDYKGSLFRVGELMFEDKSFNPVKGKTDELFSALFHRRFVTPELAFSETTAYPADKLSAINMAAKLQISTIADIRNTMMMSGLEPFPFTHWETLAPAMKKAAAMHQKIAGQKPAGPFKHFWGESSRLVSTDKPFSLFLASGIPFEVTEKPASDGWTFLSDFDAKDVESGKLKSNGTTFVHGSNTEMKFNKVRFVAETLPEIFAFKHEIILQLKGVPYVEEDKPVVCAWYSESKTALLWNLSETKETITIRLDDKTQAIEIEGLDAALVKF
jgi:hypothetical protein